MQEGRRRHRGPPTQLRPKSRYFFKAWISLFPLKTPRSVPTKTIQLAFLRSTEPTAAETQGALPAGTRVLPAGTQGGAPRWDSRGCSLRRLGCSLRGLKGCSLRGLKRCSLQGLGCSLRGLKGCSLQRLGCSRRKTRMLPAETQGGAPHGDSRGHSLQELKGVLPGETQGDTPCRNSRGAPRGDSRGASCSRSGPLPSLCTPAPPHSGSRSGDAQEPAAPRP